MLKPLYKWMGQRVHGRYAEPMLMVLFFLESTLLFILPTDPMLIMYCIEQRQRAYRYALLATIASVLGGIASYGMGYYVWHYFGQTLVHNSWINLALKPSDFYYLCDLYKRHAYIAILIAGFTPVPYKAATFTAGFCGLALIPFIVCSWIARGARFFLYALVISLWGEQIKEYIDRYFNLLVLLIVLLISGSLWLCNNIL